MTAATAIMADPENTNPLSDEKTTLGMSVMKSEESIAKLGLKYIPTTMTKEKNIRHQLM